MKIIKNKKGNFPDIFSYIETILIISFVFVMVVLILTNFNTKVQSSTVFVNESKTASSNYLTAITTNGDYAIPIIFLLFVGFSVVAARLIPSSSKFIMVSIGAILFIPIIAAIVANVWDGFRNNATISTTLLNLPLTSFFMDHMVIFSLIYSFLVAIALLTKEDRQ